MSKVIAVSDRKVRIVHQLGGDGKPYAEDVTIEIADEVDSSRMAWLVAQDGRTGLVSFGFTAQDAGDGVEFPE